MNFKLISATKGSIKSPFCPEMDKTYNPNKNLLLLMLIQKHTSVTMLTPKIIIACVCFIISSTSAQSTVYDDAGYYPAWIFEDVLRELKELKAMVDQLTVATKIRQRSACFPAILLAVFNFRGLCSCYSVAAITLPFTYAH